MKRESAWRVFAGEFNDSTLEIKGDGEKTPSFVVTPLGAKINRLFAVGVLTDVENISEKGDLVRAHISDPTGVFTLYSGQYQQEVTDALQKIDVPAFVAVVGKSRTYSPEEGTIFVSIRPEEVVEVDASVRDQWIIDTCKSTKERIEAFYEAKKMDPSNAYDLKKLGYSTDLAEGIVAALKHYKDVDLNKYITLIEESLQYLQPGSQDLPELEKPVKEEKEEVAEGEPVDLSEDEVAVEESVTESKVDVEKPDDESFKEIEETVLGTIKKIEGDDGASWDEITIKCEKSGLDKDSIEEALTSLMDKGLIYEPVLGTIKTT